MNIEAQLKMLALYLDTLPGGKHPNPTTAAYVSLPVPSDPVLGSCSCFLHSRFQVRSLTAG